MKLLANIFLFVYLLLTCSKVYCQNSIFTKDSVTFVEIITDNTPHPKLGCHFIDEYKQLLSCDPIKRKRLVFVDSAGRVFWHENPQDSVEREVILGNKKFGETNWDSFYYEHTRSLPLFTMSKKGDKIYYQKGSENKFLAYSLSKKDPVKSIDIVYFLLLDTPEITPQDYLMTYVQDTTLVLGTQHIDCYIFCGSNCCIGDIGEKRIKRKIFVEKISFLPILTFDEWYKDKFKTDGKGKSVRVTELLMTKIILPEKYKIQ